MLAVMATAVLGLPCVAEAGPIKYGSPGVVNLATYSFTAVADGDITAYFVGQTAGYGSDLGMLVNGVSTGVFGLQNHNSPRGTAFVLGTVQAGDVLTFQLRVSTTNFNGPPPVSYNLFSDPSLNPVVGAQHIYSSAYTFDAGDPDIPGGTYIGFEDISPLSGGDRDYDDHEFVFTNVAVVSTPDGGATVALLGVALSGLGLLRRRRD